MPNSESDGNGRPRINNDEREDRGNVKLDWTLIERGPDLVFRDIIVAGYALKELGDARVSPMPVIFHVLEMAGVWSEACIRVPDPEILDKFGIMPQLPSACRFIGMKGNCALEQVTTGV